MSSKWRYRDFGFVMPWLLAATLLVALWGCEEQGIKNTGINLRDSLGIENAEGFRKALKVREFDFPRDHGAHPGYRNEWWYLTGNLRDAKGNEFGYQVSFFRVQLSPAQNQAKRLSPWAAKHIWMAHVALTNGRSGKHHSEERFSRESLGLAGVQASPFNIWLDNWQIVALDNKTWQLAVATDAFKLQLNLAPSKPPVLMGEQGLSQKSATPGNASYYYSITRLHTEGKITVKQRDYWVSGNSWFDREWGSSALDKDQQGWDWFSLQLNSGEELMYYRLRNLQGQTHPYSAGIWVDKLGRTQPISAEEIVLSPTVWWQSSEGSRYPVGWQLTYHDRHWHIDALVENQLMDTQVRYWEGAIKIFDSEKRQVGSGYLELTGYE
ncbi:MAG: lipocalin-like domain-containing protein [Candidatus Reddybacter sp.]